jgi:sodium/pantothenate symporter
VSIAWAIVAVLVIFVALSIYVRRFIQNYEDYWVMGRKATWWMFAGTLCASFVSLATFVGGVGVAWAWGPMPFLLFYTSSFTFGWIIAIVLVGMRMRKLECNTISEFYQQRFGNSGRTLLGGLGIALAGVLYFYLLIQVQGGGIVISTLFDIPLITGVAIMITVVALTLALSGMWSVVATDTFTMFVFAIIMIVVLPATINAVGGLGEGLAAISAQEAWSATGNSGLGMGYFIGLALAWLAIIGGSPHLINRSLIVDGPKSLFKGSFVAYVLVVILSIFVFLSSAMLVDVIEPGTIEPDQVSTYAALNVWPWALGFLLIGGAMAAAFTTANTMVLTVAQGIVDLFRLSIKPDLTDRSVRRLTSLFSVVVLIAVGLLAAQELWILAIASSLAGIIASLGFFPTLILSLYWKRLTLKAVNIMLWTSVPLGAFMIVTNYFWDWFAPFPTIYSFPIGFGACVLTALAAKDAESSQ